MSSGYNNDSAYSGMIDSISGSTLSFSGFILETDEESYEDDVLTLEVAKKKKGSKKDNIIEDVEISISKIKETKLKINFK